MVLNRRGTGAGSPNVAIPSGDLFPNGVDQSPANPDIQASVRPMGWLFRSTPGYPGVRVGPHKIDLAHPQGQSIHFVPTRYAENLEVSANAGSGPPAMVDVANASKTTDLADLPGSEFLDDEGKLPGYMGRENRGIYLGDSSGAPVSDGVPRHGGNVGRDMGDRDPERFVSTAFYDRLLHNPNVVLRENLRDDPVATTIWAVVLVGFVGMLANNAERAFRGRRGRGVAATAGAAPAVAAEASTKTVVQSAETVAQAAEKSVEASAAVVKEAEKTVEKAAETVEDTATK